MITNLGKPGVELYGLKVISMDHAEAWRDLEPPRRHTFGCGIHLSLCCITLTLTWSQWGLSYYHTLATRMDYTSNHDQINFCYVDFSQAIFFCHSRKKKTKQNPANFAPRVQTLRRWYKSSDENLVPESHPPERKKIKVKETLGAEANRSHPQGAWMWVSAVSRGAVPSQAVSVQGMRKQSTFPLKDVWLWKTRRAVCAARSPFYRSVCYGGWQRKTSWS